MAVVLNERQASAGAPPAHVGRLPAGPATEMWRGIDSAWAESAALSTGLTVVAGPEFIGVDEISERLDREFESTLRLIEDQSRPPSATPDARTREALDAEQMVDLAMFEAAKIELSRGRCGVVDGSAMPQRAAYGDEVMLLGVVKDGRQFSILFTFPTHNYGNLEAAKEVCAAVSHRDRQAYVDRFNQLPVAHRRAAIESRLAKTKANQERRALPEGLAEPVKHIPGYTYDMTTWLVVPRP